MPNYSTPARQCSVPEAGFTLVNVTVLQAEDTVTSNNVKRHVNKQLGKTFYFLRILDYYYCFTKQKFSVCSPLRKYIFKPFNVASMHHPAWNKYQTFLCAAFKGMDHWTISAPSSALCICFLIFLVCLNLLFYSENNHMECIVGRGSDSIINVFLHLAQPETWRSCRKSSISSSKIPRGQEQQL